MTTETIIEVPLEDLHDSPFQPRTEYSGIEELAQTIKAEGRIHQALLVRPRVGPLFAGDPDAAAGYEIVFGHRRRRAAEQAGLATAPCTVRAMTDAQVRSAQMVENVARENMSALDEGAGFKAQVDAGDATADEIAQRIGKSRSHVYGRIKLLQLAGAPRAALLAGEIDSEAALLVARLRTPKLQEKALSTIRAHNLSLEEGGATSYRRIKSLLAEKFTLRLKEAIFDIEDEVLLPSAGHCIRCPKRTGHAPEYADLVEGTTWRWGGHQPGSADLCTDPDCWDAKKTAHLKREADKLAASGKAVVTGNKARQALGAHGDVKGAYLPLDKVKAALAKLPKAGDAKAFSLPVVHIQDQRTGKIVKAYARADLEATGVMKPEAKPAKGQQESRAEQAKRETENRARLTDNAIAEEKRRFALLRHVRQVAAARPRDAFDLRLVAAAALGGVPWNDKDTLATLWDVKDADALQKRVDTLSVDDLTQLLMDCAIVDNIRCNPYSPNHDKPGPLLALANHYGIDAKAIMAAAAAAESAPTPSPAGASASKPKAAPAPKTTKPAGDRGVKYRCTITGATWSGRGLQPAWLRAGLAKGKTLADYLVEGQKAAAGTAIVDDEAGCAGEPVQRQLDMLEEAPQ
jgi:ParB/RepB/Spo0J family partition protein